MKKHLLILFLLAGLFSQSAKSPFIKPFKTVRLELAEPSEIVSLGRDRFIVLANKGFIYEINTEGKVIRKAETTGYDLEGACSVKDKLYVTDESLRQVMIFQSHDLSFVETRQLQYHGPRNLGFEAITYNPEAGIFLLATEKNPQLIIEYSNHFIQGKQVSIKGINEISALDYLKGHLYILSDEQNTVFKVNPKNYTITQSWKLPVINPEGICFTDEGDMVIVSDDMGKMFFFKNPEL
ncbi:MAG: SdiA-regulated domain-containing protein [Bacteroidia bacterium]|nr:SdiA-regulated domain-containing protein [Bacteroidia bacterium]